MTRENLAKQIKKSRMHARVHDMVTMHADGKYQHMRTGTHVFTHVFKTPLEEGNNLPCPARLILVVPETAKFDYSTN